MDITISETDLTSAMTSETTNSGYRRELGIGFRILMVVLVIQSVITSIGNSLTIFVVWKDPDLRTSGNMHIASLACADFIGGITGLFDMIWFASEDIDTFLSNCKYCCLLWYILFFISFGTSLFSMTLIALDRWLYIAYPLKYYIWITLSKTAVMIGIAWTAAILFGLLPLEFNNFDKLGLCMNAIILKEYSMFGVGTILFGSCGISFYFYFRIFLIARKQQRTIQAQAGYLGYTSHTYREIKILFLICCITFTCWIPFYVDNLPGLPAISSEASNFIISLSLFNSCVNFFLYSAKNTAFRKSFLKSFPCVKKIFSRR